MSLQIKTYVASQVSKYLRDNYKTISISTLKILRNKIPGQFSVYVPLDNLNSETLRKEFKCDKSTNNSIKDIAKCEITNHQGVKILLENNFFVESILKSIVVDPPKKGIPTPKRIIFEYSSPNIAKPFHVGHLRSTIIGNFLSNINKYLCEDVVRINYLGDWGTQFGMLKVGIDLSEMKLEQIKENPIQLLYEAYVAANKLATVDDSINIKAREVFKQLESGQFEDIKKWEMYREFTINELKRTYERLGVVFDNYAWESMYSSKDIQHIVNQLEESGIIKLDDVGRKVACVNDRKVTVTKSDGSSLYLTRDIAAALDRYDKYSFDEMYYIVDNAQTDHFVALFNILNQMKTSFAKNCKHIKFGRIKGMSTRKGTVVFLKDILDEAKNKMLDSQKTSLTTKASLDDEVTSDILGTTAVIINDLKIKRQRDYEFSWENALQNHGDSGIRLQYLHCRLWSIEQNCGFTLPDHCKPELIPEPEALLVIQELARFDDVLEHSRNEMEACVLVIYLFKLSGVVNSAIKVLQVKNQPNEVAGQRLLLFHASRLVVKQGLEILGIKPLNQM